jgi:outer membrane immunogenic protein
VNAKLVSSIFVRSSTVKRNVLGLVSVLALAIAAPMGAANAADMAAKMPYSAPPAPSYFNWTGFYIGANFGGGYATTNVTGNSVFDAVAPVSSTFSTSYGGSGVLGGGQIGVNYQFTPHWVMGVEADIDGSNINGLNSTCSANAVLGTVGCAGVSSKLNDFGTVRGRLGYAGDNLLLYGTGGWAWGESSSSSNLTCVVFSAGTSCPGGSDTFTGGSSSASTTTTNGWAAGAGLEYAFARNWAIRAEYLHIQLNGNGQTFASTGTVAGVPFTLSTSTSATTNIDMARFGLNYIFH